MSEVESSMEKSEDRTFETEPAAGVTGQAGQADQDRSRADAPKRRRSQLVAATAVVVLVVALGLVLLAWWFYGSRGAGRPVPAPRTVAADQPSGPVGEATGPSQNSITITTDAIASGGIKVEVVQNELAGDSAANTSTGVVKANTYRESPVISLVTGIVREVKVVLGQQVKAGEPLALVFSDELTMAQTRYLTATAELDEHHKHHRRTINLVEIGAASREELEQATTKLRSAELEVTALRQRLVQLGLSAERIKGLNLSGPINSYVALAAPISGVIVNRSINPGEVVQANAEVLRVADLSSVWVIAQVYEKDLASIRIGSGASVVASAYPGRALRGKIAYVDPALDPATRTAQVRIELANPGQKLKLGMYVDVTFATIGGAGNTVPMLPATAVQNLNNQQVVFLATDTPGVFQMRAVRVGAEINGRVPVLEGLTAGERVVTQGSFLLRAEWLKLHPGS